MQIRVAVVDDERFFREAISEVLETAGIDCVSAPDGESGLALAADPEVGVMLLDIRMPGTDGIEVLRRLRDARPELRVLVLSASTDQETVLEALRLGACDYLAKPLHDEELVFAVRRAVESYALSADAERLRSRLGRVVSLTEEIARGAARLQDPARTSYLHQAAVDGAADLLQAGRTSLLVREPDSGDAALGDEWRLAVVAAVGQTEPIEELSPAVVGQGIAGRVAARGEALLVSARSQDARFEDEPVPGRYGSDSFVVVPLFSRSGPRPDDAGPGAAPATSLAEAMRTPGDPADEAFGVLCATEPAAGEAFGAEDLALLRLLAGRVAELLTVSGPVKEAPPPVAAEAGALAPPLLGGSPDRDADLVRGICDALVNEVEPERVLEAVLEPIARELSAAPVSLYLLDPAGSGLLVCEAQLDGGARVDRKTLPGNEGLSGMVFQSGHLVATQSPDLDARYQPDVDTPEDGRAGPTLCVPLRLRGKVVGLCRVFLPVDGIASPRTGEALSAALSAAVRNVLLYRSLVESIEEVAEARRQARQ